jgi:hypothetical protein
VGYLLYFIVGTHPNPSLIKRRAYLLKFPKIYYAYRGVRNKPYNALLKISLSLLKGEIRESSIKHREEVHDNFLQNFTLS